MNQQDISIQDIYNILQPETDLERFFMGLPEIQAGLLWGEPRYGHPEGKVLYHIVEVFRNIDGIIPPLSIKAEKLCASSRFCTIHLNMQKIKVIRVIGQSTMRRSLDFSQNNI